MNTQHLRAAMGALVLGAALLAAGCAAVVGGGAVVAGISAADRRTTGSQVEDNGIELRAGSRIREVLGAEGVHINITSYNRQVLLSGEVANAAQRAQAEALLREQATVREVFNELSIAPFVSTLGERSKDTVLTTQVKASLLHARDVPAPAIKVVTERRVVYLMGIVTAREARRAAEIARGVNDVAKVVRLFEPISEAELARLRPAPRAAQDEDSDDAPQQ